METSFRVDPSDRSARTQAWPLAAPNAGVATGEVIAADVRPEEDDESIDWFVNLLLAENASRA